MLPELLSASPIGASFALTTVQGLKMLQSSSVSGKYLTDVLGTEERDEAPSQFIHSPASSCQIYPFRSEIREEYFTCGERVIGTRFCASVVCPSGSRSG